MISAEVEVNGSRGRYLLTWGVGYIGIGMSNIVAPTQGRVEAFGWLPFWDNPQLWGWIWLVAGITAIATSFAHGHSLTNRSDRWGFMVLTIPPLVWVVVFSVALMLTPDRRYIATVLIYAPIFLGQVAASGMGNSPPSRANDGHVRG